MIDRAKFIRITLATTVGVWLVATVLYAGPLNPPAGPITSTYKTMAEIEPRTAINAVNTPGDTDSLFKITQPGSYYLTSNFTGVVGKHGIEIAASGVSIDLNGFDIAGVSTMGNFDGITTSMNDLRNISVRNGSVRNWGRGGVALGRLGATNCRVEDVIASGNTSEGIFVGKNSIVTKCSVSGGSHGIYASGSTISECSVTETTNTGITANEGCVLVNNTIYRNSVIGAVLLFGSSMSNCSVFSNGTLGVSSGFNCVVVDNSVRSNGLDGIACFSNSTVRGNTCSDNGIAGDGAGILVAVGAVDTRIEGNNCTGNDVGIDVRSAGNIIIRNTCSGNTTNWRAVAGNVCLVVQAATSLSINGNAGGVAPGSLDPSANFTY